MQKITVLGTSGAVTNAQRDNVSLVFSSTRETSEYHLLLECGGSAAHKLAKIGIKYEILQDVILSHAHLDHIYGLPGLLFSINYRDEKRTAPLRIYCPEAAIKTISALLEIFDLRKTCRFPLEIYGIRAEEQAPVFENEHVEVTSTPVNHDPNVPTCGIRIKSKLSGKSMVYSSDTSYSENLIRLVQEADILFHECAGLSHQPIVPIHSNALQVGNVARQSACHKLVLLHLDSVLDNKPAQLIAEIRQNYSGNVVVPSDFDEFQL